MEENRQRFSLSTGKISEQFFLGKTTPLFERMVTGIPKHVLGSFLINTLPTLWRGLPAPRRKPCGYKIR
jgi:hypothetical protein